MEREGPRLKDTRTNNQPQILFNHHLGGPNYPKKTHSQRTSLSLGARARCACVRARALHLFIEGRFISGLAVYLFSTNRHCCGVLWAHFTNATRPFFLPPPPGAKPPHPSLRPHTQPPPLLAGGISFSLPLFLAYFSPGSTRARKA